MEASKGLKRLRDYKQLILETIISDEELVKAIANNGTHFLDTPVENPSELLYKQIFPYKWTAPEIPERKEVYITMSFAVDRMDGGIFNDIAFAVYIFVHKDIMRVWKGDGYMLRSDFIMERLEADFHKSTEFGVGRLELVDTGEVFLSPDIPGFYLTFVTVDQAAR